MAVLPQFEAKCAIRYGKKQFERILQTAGDINLPGPKGRSALFLAARAGRFEHVRLLLGKGADPNLTDDSDEAPLQAASRYGHLECVAEVIRAGAVINRCPDPSKTDYCETALYSAVVHQRNAVAVYLLQCGADPNLSASGRRLPLNAAAWRGETEICRHLVHAGAVINACDARGSTALGGALRRGTVETVQALLDLGADPNLKEERGDRPLTIAMRREVGECLPFVQALVAGKADIFATNDDGSTAADWALKMERWKAARYLESLGARPTPDEELPQPTTSFEDGATMEVISCRVITHDPSDDDRKEAAILQKLPLTFLRGVTWEVSPAHWVLLKCLTTPLTLDRAAYFVRGYRNAPKGTELLDGPIVLGESYLDAVERFVGFGLARRLTVSELVGLNSTGEELSKIARGHKFSLPTHKKDKVPAFVSALPDIAEEIASRKTWYQTTESGSSLIQNSHWKPDKALVADISN